MEHSEFLDEPFYQACWDAAEIKRLKSEGRDKRKEMLLTWQKKVMVPVGQNNLCLINDAGGIIASGSDQSFGPQTHREIELLAQGGISPLDIIRNVTLNTAIFLGKERDIGSIEEGKLADMVILDADPLADINNIKKIHLVIEDGRVIDRSRLNFPVNQKAD